MRRLPSSSDIRSAAPPCCRRPPGSSPCARS
jgi:hypothetical protein